MEKPVVIFGAGGLGKVALEILESHDIVAYCFLDDDPTLHGQEIGEVSIMGATDDQAFLKFVGHKCEACVAIDENTIRRQTVESIVEKRKVMPMNLVHDKAYISERAEIGHGNLVNMGAKVGTYSVIGNHCILHTNAIVDFEVKLGDYVQVGTGATIGANAVIEDDVFIGSGAVIVSGVKIGKGARIGAGSVVIENINEDATVFGNPAKAFGS